MLENIGHNTQSLLPAFSSVGPMVLGTTPAKDQRSKRQMRNGQYLILHPGNGRLLRPKQPIRLQNLTLICAGQVRHMFCSAASVKRCRETLHAHPSIGSPSSSKHAI